MKGVSAVIATILLLMITVALAATSYVWFSSVFSTVTAAGSNATERGVSGIATAYTIESAKYTGGNVTQIAIRNTGSVDLTASAAAVYISDQNIAISSTSGSFTAGGPPGILNVNNATFGPVVGKTVKVSFGPGVPQIATIS